MPICVNGIPLRYGLARVLCAGLTSKGKVSATACSPSLQEGGVDASGMCATDLVSRFLRNAPRLAQADPHSTRRHRHGGVHDVEEVPQQVRLYAGPEDAVEVDADVDFGNQGAIDDVGQFQDLQRLRNDTTAKTARHHGNRGNQVVRLLHDMEVEAIVRTRACIGFCTFLGKRPLIIG